MSEIGDGQTDTEPTVGTGAAAGTGLQGGAGPEATPIALEVADCPGAKRLIGILRWGSDCSLDDQVPGEWAASNLFAVGSPGVAALTTSLPPEFALYCAFDYVGQSAEPSAEEYSSLLSAVDGADQMYRTSVAADCRGEFEQGDLYDASVGVELLAAFSSNIDWDMGAQIDTDYAAREHVEVAVLDTVSQAVADDPQLSPSNEHGQQMTALIREIDCPAERPDCVDRIRNVMAMPRQDWATAPDWIGGGHTGTQGDLAMAVYEAVQGRNERSQLDPSGTSSRLILNLSLGWASFASQALDSSRGPAAALLLAMRYASCNGALLLAAAGNTRDELCPELDAGPLAPASFEETAAPTPSECSDLGFTIEWPQDRPIFADPQSNYVPLVHAVGALDEFDTPLINARVGGMPRLAALGAHGLSSEGEESLAGSSVSTAVASATAAVLWSYRPELTGPEIMELIYDSGYDTGASADFALTEAQMPVRRVSVCAALDSACVGQDDSCPKPGCVATAPAGDGYLAGYADAVELVLADLDTTTEDFTATAEVQAAACDVEPEPTTNLITPQPEIPICSRCGLTKPPGFTLGDDQLTMTIDSVYAGEIIGLRLITADNLGNRSYQDFRPAVIESLNAQPEPVDVTRVLVEASDATAAALEFTLLSGRSQTNRIPVIDG